MFGRYVLLPVIGKELFASLTMAGKLAHDYLGFAFMVGIALMFVIWVRHNIPSREDLTWLAKGGGMVGGGHPLGAQVQRRAEADLLGRRAWAGSASACPACS